MNKHFLSILLSFFLTISAKCQIVNGNSILNSGGSVVHTATFNLEWSLGEAVSIIPFANSQIHLNTGFLQPLTPVVTGIFDVGSQFSNQQINISPNPSVNYIIINGQLESIGNLTIRLFDTRLTELESHSLKTFTTSFQDKISLQSFPAGSYFVQIIFVNSMNKVRNGVYKIIKL